jgi:hypothetical protein
MHKQTMFLMAAAVLLSAVVAAVLYTVETANAQGNMTAGGGNMTKGGNATAGGNMTNATAGGGNMTKK